MSVWFLTDSEIIMQHLKFFLFLQEKKSNKWLLFLLNQSQQKPKKKSTHKILVIQHCKNVMCYIFLKNKRLFGFNLSK